MNDPLNFCKPDAGTGKFSHGMQALESAKEFIGIGHVETCAIIAYEKYLLLIFSHPADFDITLNSRCSPRPLGAAALLSRGDVIRRQTNNPATLLFHREIDREGLF
jgi:hypothetical protein